MEQQRLTLPKTERLTSKYAIDRLFDGGSRSFASFPLRVVYNIEDAKTEYGLKVMFSVSKKHFKHAVDRNKVKRQLREAYRLNRIILEEYTNNNPEKTITIAFIWSKQEILSMEEVNKKMKFVLSKIADKCS